MNAKIHGDLELGSSTFEAFDSECGDPGVPMRFDSPNSGIAILAQGIEIGGAVSSNSQTLVHGALNLYRSKVGGSLKLAGRYKSIKGMPAEVIVRNPM